MTTRTHNATHQIEPADLAKLAAACKRLSYHFIVIDEEGRAGNYYTRCDAANRMANQTTGLLYDHTEGRVRVVDFEERDERQRRARLAALAAEAAGESPVDAELAVLFGHSEVTPAQVAGALKNATAAADEEETVTPSHRITLDHLDAARADIASLRIAIAAMIESRDSMAAAMDDVRFERDTLRGILERARASKAAKWLGLPVA